MGGIAPGKLKSRRGWPSTPRRLLHRSNFLDPGIQELTAGKTLSTLRGWRHSHRHRFAAAWPFLVRQNGPFFHRRRHAQGRIVRWNVLATDIDDWKKAEEELRREEQELRRMTDAIPQHIMVLAADR